MDFYKMAAYTYGVSTDVKPENFAKVDSRLERMQRRRSYKGLDRYVRNALDDILEPLSYGVRDTERMLKLPKDYQYRDGKPGEAVRAGTPFGKKLSLRKGPRRPRRVDDFSFKSPLRYRYREPPLETGHGCGPDRAGGRLQRQH